ncbi:DNA repair protein RecN [Paenibacillus thalictri]|uniref:DNA repair protein RecN n=1 Tax=Paenibacillus thalictri TaxID=2527873 RepID=A0A4Q9DSK2_9BACL|nr:DNA repair protein RecN [Paenibacillus thalictri]TBL79864.1 DNA repair protein RecN [Paenibacillus thalictri]
MLQELSIKNLAVVESVQLHFHQGFHVLTGETGAGKSIIIDALSLIAGSRGSADLVRYGESKAEIEALFHIEPDHPVWEALGRFGIEPDDEFSLIVRRDITAQGKSVSRINGQMVNLSALKEIGDHLVNIHGQHEHQSLFKVEQHMKWLDLYGEKEIGPIKREYETAYDAYMGVRKSLIELSETSKQALQMQDLYRFQCEEISAAALKVGEDETLAEERRKLANSEKLYQSAAESYDLLYGGKGLDTIGKALHKLQDIVVLDPAALNPILEQVQSAFYQLEDAAFQMRNYREDIEFNPARLDEIEERFDVLSALKRKYGNSIREILDYYAKIQAELNIIENKDDLLRELQEREMRLKDQLLAIARRLTSARMRMADSLASEIVTELRDLHMERTQFKTLIIPDETKLTRAGTDQVEFMISANPGEPLRSLNKIASGGEISRVMLALKAIFARMDQIPVLVFDEVDTGVSGRAAQAIAEKLSALARGCQVFSITHLPQVACMADAQYYIHKQTNGDRTFTMVEDLSEQGRIHELARMLGGVEVTGKTLEHATEMLSLAGKKKASI